jgi:hypothetical protein
VKTSSASGFVLISLSAFTLTIAGSIYCYKNLVPAGFTPEKITIDENFVYNVPVQTAPITFTPQQINNCTIESPFPELDKIAGNVYLETHAGTTYTTANHTKIIVPSFAFTDQNGNILDAEVEMQVREFQEPFEFFVSGIPLQKDSQTLAPSALLEISASSFGKKVFIRKDNPLIVIPAGLQDTGLGIFKLDSCEWTLHELFSAKKEVIDPDTFFTGSIPEKYAIALKCKTKMEETREFFFSGKHSPDHFIFSIVNYIGLHPELKPLTTVNWICIGSDALQNYHMIFGYGQERLFAEKIIYGDQVRIRKSGEDYFLEYSFRNKQISVLIAPYILNPTDRLNFELAFNSYTLQYENNCSQNWAMNSGLSTKILPASSINNQFTIDSVGIWCLGKTTTARFPKHINAEFIDEAGRKIPVEHGWILSNGKTLFSISDFTNFGFNPFSKNIFWTILPGNKIGIIYPDEFRRQRNEHGTAQFKIRIYEESDVLRKMLVTL